MPKPTLLLYDPTGAAWAAPLKRYCAVQGLRLRPVEAGDLGRTAAQLARGVPSAEGVPPAGPIPEPMLVFCHLSGGQLDRLLAALRRMEVPRTVLKAVLTPHNAGWSLYALYQELCRERLSLP